MFLWKETGRKPWEVCIAELYELFACYCDAQERTLQNAPEMTLRADGTRTVKKRTYIDNTSKDPVKIKENLAFMKAHAAMMPGLKIVKKRKVTADA